MATPIEQLLILQDRDRRISRLQRELELLPGRRKAIESQLDSHRQALTEAEDELRKGQLEQKDLEARIDAHQERIKKLRQQQLEVKNNDDYRAFEKEVNAVEEEIVSIEDRELAVMEKIERLLGTRDEKRESLNAEEHAVQEELDQLSQRASNIEKEQAELRVSRDALSQDCDPEWLARYDRIFKNKGDAAVVPIENGTCGGCHMKLPPQMAHDARKGDTMTVCMYCGRLLYFPA